jgi:hypothetical protein
MAADRRAQEMLARCLSSAVFHYYSGSSSRAEAAMAAGYRELAAAIEGGVGGDTDAMIPRPLRDLLVRRYGPEVGGRLADEFGRELLSGAPREPDNATS